MSSSKAFLIGLLVFYATNNLSWSLETAQSEGLKFIETVREEEEDEPTPQQPTQLPVSRNSCGQSVSKASRTQELAACIRDSQCHQTLVVVHRGRGMGAPENSRNAVEKSIEAGFLIVEIDLRFSKDGKIYVLHDAKLDRTTTFKGNVSDFTSGELSRALLKNGEPLPQFQDLFLAARGRAILDLHFKSNAVEAVADWIAACGSFDDVLFQVDVESKLISAALAQEKYPQMIVMPLVRSFEELARAEKILGRRPAIVQFVRFPSKKSVQTAHQRDMKFFANTFIQERLWILGSYRINRLLAAHPDLIQTNRPGWILKKLKRVGRD